MDTVVDKVASVDTVVDRLVVGANVSLWSGTCYRRWYSDTYRLVVWSRNHIAQKSSCFHLMYSCDNDIGQYRCRTPVARIAHDDTWKWLTNLRSKKLLVDYPPKLSYQSNLVAHIAEQNNHQQDNTLHLLDSRHRVSR